MIDLLWCFSNDIVCLLFDDILIEIYKVIFSFSCNFDLLIIDSLLLCASDSIVILEDYNLSFSIARRVVSKSQARDAKYGDWFDNFNIESFVMMACSYLPVSLTNPLRPTLEAKHPLRYELS